jgi:hypothetical protein
MYKLENGSLFELRKNALGGSDWMRAAVVPRNIKSLALAIDWYLSL